MRKFEGYKRGVNLGGWLSQCGAENYHSAHYDSFITEADIEKIASWGLDHVRLPIDYNVIQNEDGSLKPEGFDYIDNCIAWCKKNKLHIVLDLHKAMGYVFDDKSYCNFFFEEKLQDYFVNLWVEMAKRYGGFSDFVTFELLNEVTMPEAAQKWNEIADRTIKAIREINQEIRIMIGGIYNSSIYGLSLLNPPADDKIVFTFHCYSPMIFTHQGAEWVEHMPLDASVYQMNYPDTTEEYLKRSRQVFGNDFDNEFTGFDGADLNQNYFERLLQDAIAIGEKYDVPLYCGEYGVIDLAGTEDTLKWYKDMHAALEKYELPRAAWSYKEMNFGLSGAHYAAVIEEIDSCL